MARYRRSYRREKRDYTWQPFVFQTRVAVPAGAENTVHTVHLKSMIPGVGSIVDGSIDAFDNPHILQRIRGAITHSGDAGVQQRTSTWFGLTLAGIKVPVGLSVEELPDLFNSSMIDEFVMCHNVVCDAGAQTEAAPNWHMVDSKSKRKFDVGDRLNFMLSLLRPHAAEFNVDIAMNLRLLWSLQS